MIHPKTALVALVLTVLLSTPAAQAASETKAELPLPPHQVWEDKEEPGKAVLLCLPEMGLHSGAYEDFCKDMSDRGMICYAMDLRGFGKCLQEPERSHVDVEKSVSDVVQMLHKLHAEHPKLSVYVVGEGLGAAIALAVCARHHDLLSGAILSAPGNKWLTPGWNTRLAEAATNDRPTYERWRGDKLSRETLTSSEKSKIQSFMSKSEKVSGEVHRLPIMVVQGKGDRFLDQHSSQAVFDALVSPDKEITEVSRMGHIIFEYGQTPPVISDMIETWITLPAPKQEAKRLL